MMRRSDLKMSSAKLLMILVSSGFAVSCNDHTAGTAPSGEGTRWCAPFVVDDGLGMYSDTVCGCVPENTAVLDFLEDKCEDEIDEPAGGANCEPDDFPTEYEECEVEPPPDVETTGVAEDPLCDTYKPGSGECCEIADPMCCEDPYDNDGCIGYDFGAFGYTAPGPHPDRSLELDDAEITLTVHPGTGDEDDAQASMTATADYGFEDCGASLCPFYLADLRFSANTALTVNVKLGGVTKTKTVSGLEAHLIWPMLANYYPDAGHDVQFKPGSLVFGTSFNLSGSQFGAENGDYWLVSKNTATIHATANPTTKTVNFDNLEFDVQGATGVNPVITFTGSPIITGSPPVATGTVSTSCQGTNRGKITFDSTATDANSDIILEMWRLNGVLVKVGSSSYQTGTLPNGTRNYSLFVMDARGAFRIKEGVVTLSC